MSTAVAIQPAIPRPSPVPIAAARPKKPQQQQQQQLQQQPKPSPTGRDSGAISGKPGVTSANNVRSRRERPCDACRRRKSRCVINEGAALCVLCEFHKQECTFVQSPLPRKRKVVGDGKKDSPNNQKKRYVVCLTISSHHLALVVGLSLAWVPLDCIGPDLNLNDVDHGPSWGSIRGINHAISGVVLLSYHATLLTQLADLSMLSRLH